MKQGWLRALDVPSLANLLRPGYSADLEAEVFEKLKMPVVIMGIGIQRREGLKENLPAGARLQVGSAVLEVSPWPHTGCHKFVARVGVEAMKFVNSEVGKQLCLRGINAKVVQGGVVKVGQVAKKV